MVFGIAAVKHLRWSAICQHVLQIHNLTFIIPNLCVLRVLSTIFPDAGDKVAAKGHPQLRRRNILIIAVGTIVF